MKFLIIILLLINGEPQAAKLVGAAESRAACQKGAAEIVQAHPEQFKAPEGTVLALLCAPVPKYKPDGTVDAPPVIKIKL